MRSVLVRELVCNLSAAFRFKLIQQWKMIKGREATYRALLTALCEAGEVNSAEKLVDCLKGMS